MGASRALQAEGQRLRRSSAMGSPGESLPGALEEHLVGARHRPSDLSQPSGEASDTNTSLSCG